MLFRGTSMTRHDTRWFLKINLAVLTLLAICYAGSAPAAERYAVVGKTANIRSGPGTKYEILCQAEEFYPLNMVEKKGNWFRVMDFENDEGWIHKSMVRKMSSVITTKPKCNIRSGPGMKHDIVFITKEGVPFKTLRRKGNWINVRHSAGHEGWIHKSLVW